LFDIGDACKSFSVRFEIKGEYNTFSVTVSWDEGRLDGPDDLVAAITKEAERLEGQAIRARDADDQVYSTNDHLLNPHSTRELIRSVLDPNSPFDLHVVDGEFPPAPRYRTRINETS
jgi:hypothetical protein